MAKLITGLPTLERHYVEPEGDWEAAHITLLFPNGQPFGGEPTCLDCADAVYELLQACARSHGHDLNHAAGEEGGAG